MGKERLISRELFSELAHELAFPGAILYAELLMNNISLRENRGCWGSSSYIVFLFSTTCHEASHALASKIGGDSRAAIGGQVSLKTRFRISGGRRLAWVVFPI